MALIVCPECGKNFSDRAAACPECGCPTSEIVGQSNNTSEGQIIIANNAFDDGRYDEAYQLFAQLYAQIQGNPQIVVRLGLATAARDYFNNGIPNSTKDLLAKGLELAKNNASSYDAFVSQITPYITDAKKVIDDTKTSVIEGISTALNQTTPMRSAGAMVADALFSPVVSANRNLYEDRRTAEANTKILNNAIANKKIITATLDTFGSYVLKTVAEMLTEPLDKNSSLCCILSEFARNKEDSDILNKITGGSGSAYGLCYGEEKKILSARGTAHLMNGNAVQNKDSFSFSLDRGEFTLTNYKITYNAVKPSASFTQLLDDLICVKMGSRAENSKDKILVEMIFKNRIRVVFTHANAAMNATLVALINEELKMPNR